MAAARSMDLYPGAAADVSIDGRDGLFVLFCVFVEHKTRERHHEADGAETALGSVGIHHIACCTGESFSMFTPSTETMCLPAALPSGKRQLVMER